MAETAVHHLAHQLDDSASIDRRSVFLSAGHKMAGSLLPAIVNLLDADGAVSSAGPQCQRKARAAG